MPWKQQLEIIKKIFTLRTGESASTGNLASFLDVSRGKVQAWERGQRPVADDLQRLGERLELSASWLLFGQGSPNEDAPGTLTADDGRIAGDLLHDLLLGHIAPSEEELSNILDLPLEEVSESMGLKFRASWHLLQRLALAGVNVNFLLTGRGHDYFPSTMLERAMLALGVSTPWEFAVKTGLPEKEVEKHFRDARKTGRMLPREWMDLLLVKFGLMPGWLADLDYPSHALRKPEPQSPAEQRLTPVAQAVAKIEEGFRSLDDDEEAVWLALQQLVERKLGKRASARRPSRSSEDNAHPEAGNDLTAER